MLENMKKLIIIVIIALSTFTLKAQQDYTTVLNYINTNITSGGSITGDELNTALLYMLNSTGNLRSGKESLTVDVEATVTFNSAMDDATYVVEAKGIDSNGNGVAVQIKTFTSTTFKATAAATCTLHYTIKKQI